MLKRLIDIFISLTALIILSPVFLFVVYKIHRELGLPIFFSIIQMKRNLAEKMIFFIENPQQIAIMGNESYKIAVEKFDAEKVNNRLIQILFT